MANDITVPGGTFLGIYGGFSVVLVRKGDKYGLKNCLTYDGDVPMVEFYDIRFLGPGFTKVGQFVSRYALSTLLQHGEGRGLCLDGGVPDWTISALDLAQAMAAVAIFLSL